MPVTKGDIMSRLTLRKVLRWDAVASGASVVLTVAGAGWLGDRLGVATWVPLAVGVGLVPWVAFLVHVGRQAQLHRGSVAVIAAGNLIWVVAAAVLIFGYPESLTITGKWIVGLFSLVVLDFGLAQLAGVRNLAAETA